MLGGGGERPKRTNIFPSLAPSSFPRVTKASAEAACRCSLARSVGPPSVCRPRPPLPVAEREGLEGRKGHLFHSLARSK